MDVAAAVGNHNDALFRTTVVVVSTVVICSGRVIVVFLLEFNFKVI